MNKSEFNENNNENISFFKKYKKWLISAGALVAVASVSIPLAIVFTNDNNDKNEINNEKLNSDYFDFPVNIDTNQYLIEYKNKLYFDLPNEINGNELSDYSIKYWLVSIFIGKSK